MLHLIEHVGLFDLNRMGGTENQLDMSGNIVRVTNRVLFCENVIVCDMLSNGEIIYRVRKQDLK